MHNTHSPSPAGGRAETGHEIPRGRIILSGWALAVLIVLVFAGLRYRSAVFTQGGEPARQEEAATAGQPAQLSEPRLLMDEPKAWQQQVAIEKAQTEEYAWMDKPAGVVRIPVDRAIELVAERGLPARRVAQP